MESLSSIKAHLDELCTRYGPSHATDDPIWFPRRYSRSDDQEIAAYVASALAYGRLAQIGRSVEVVLGYLGERPAERVRRLDPAKACRDLRRFSHRFSSGRDVALMLCILGRLLEKHGTLNEAFLVGYEAGHENVGPALSSFCRRALSASPRTRLSTRRGREEASVDGRTRRAGVRFFFSSPEDGSACKRLNMFLRWMVRRGGVDLGIWREVPASKLVVPLDTHVARLSRRLGFSRRRSADWRMALEVTEALRALDPEDPVRYDYAIYNWGLSSRRP
jgi:uncharacterized protein (TIGR02757 family)